jgi:hypothetical protein
MNQYTSDDFDRDDSDGRGIQNIHVDNDRYGPTHDFDSRDNGQDIQTIHVDNDRHGPTHDFDRDDGQDIQTIHVDNDRHRPTHDFDRDDGQDIQIIHADNDRYSPSHDFARNDVIYDQDFTRSHVVDSELFFPLVLQPLIKGFVIRSELPPCQGYTHCQHGPREISCSSQWQGSQSNHYGAVGMQQILSSRLRTY